MNAMKVAIGGLRGFVRARRRLRGPRRPTWNEQVETFASFLRVYGLLAPVLPVAIMRKEMVKVLAPSESERLAHYEPTDAGGVDAEWIRWNGADNGAVFIYLHGGGYVIGSTNTHRDLLSRLARSTGISVLAPNYRLAPEHPFPAQLEDALAVYRWVRGRGVPASRIVLGGESAGGGLTLATLMTLRDAGEPMPAAAVLLSPWVDMTSDTESFRTNARYDYINARSLDRFAGYYLGVRGDRSNPLASPVRADLSGLPTLLVHLGGAEALLDQGLQLTRNARDAGVSVELDVWPDMIHAWHVLANVIPEGQQAIDRVARFARARIATARVLSAVT
jgi:acetyl esterase/lipase